MNLLSKLEDLVEKVLKEKDDEARKKLIFDFIKEHSKGTLSDYEVLQSFLIGLRLGLKWSSEVLSDSLEKI